MQDFLVFTLSAGIAAMGDNGGTEFRGSFSWPGRGAILGMIAGAMGLDRDDRAAHSALSAHRIAVGIHLAGDSFIDFHTVQSLPAAAGRNVSTRADALAIGKKTDKLEVSLTRREYRTSVLYSVAIWEGDLDAARHALDAPVHTPFFGRKSCPFDAPYAPRIVNEPGPVQALKHAHLPFWRAAPLQSVASDPHPYLSGREVIRVDDPVCREKWHFRARTVTVSHIDHKD